MSKSIVQYMDESAVRENIEKTLGQKTPQFIASVASLVNSNEKLASCDKSTLLPACLTAASLDLPINQNLGFAYIIPYKGQAQFQMGYKGFIQLAIRSGKFKTINVTDVKEGEIKSHDRLTGKIEFEWAEDRDKLKTIGYVGYIELNDGYSKQEYKTVKELKAHGARFSQTYKKGYGLWKDDFDAMAKKTVLKLLLSKYAPMTIEMQKAQLADQAVIDDEGFRYVDNEPVDPQEMSEEKERERIIKHIQNSETIDELEKCKEAVESQDEKVKEMYDKKSIYFEEETA